MSLLQIRAAQIPGLENVSYVEITGGQNGDAWWNLNEAIFRNDQGNIVSFTNSTGGVPVSSFAMTNQVQTNSASQVFTGANPSYNLLSDGLLNSGVALLPTDALINLTVRFTFPSPQTLVSIRLVNSIDVWAYRMFNCIVQCYNASNSLLYSYTIPVVKWTRASPSDLLENTQIVTNQKFINVNTSLNSRITTSPSYSPLSSGTAILWLDAADRSTITLNVSNQVTAWTDKSGFGGGLSTVAGGLCSYSGGDLNGLPCIITQSGLTGSRCYGDFGAGQSSANTYSVFLVIQGLTVSGPNARFFGVNRTGGADFISGQGFEAQSAGFDQTILFSFTPSVINPTTMPRGAFLFTLTGNSLGAALIPAQWGIGTPSFQRQSDVNNWGLRIGEFIIYRNVLSLTEMYRVQSYLSQKWSIRGFLSAGNAVQNQPVAGFSPLRITIQADPRPVGSRIQINYTGVLQTYVVPLNANLILVQMWGGGGSNSFFSGGSPGGAAAYIEGLLRVNPGETLQIIVGAGGTFWGSGGNEDQGWGGSSGRLSGAGGGFSAVRRSVSEYLAIVGGGGGGGRNQGARDGGAGTASGDGYQGGSGGIKSTATNGGLGGGGGSATSALGRQGQAGQAQGAGGGGGGYGGGRGGTVDPSGGGGGSSFTSLLLRPVLFDGVGTTPGNSSSPLRGTAGGQDQNGTVYITPYIG